jgi:hypothetical protein
VKDEVYKFSYKCLALKAYLGAYGIMTHRLQTAVDVIDTANRLYDLHFDSSLDAMENEETLIKQQDRIAAIGKSGRKRLVKKNIGSLPMSIISMKPNNVKRYKRWKVT